MSLPLRLSRLLRSLDPRAVDAAIAAGLTLWALAQPRIFSNGGQSIVLVAMTVAIAGLRTAPLAVLAVEVAGVVLLPNRLDLPQAVAVLMAAYSAAFYSKRRVLVGLLLAAAAASVLGFGGQATIPKGLIPVLLIAPVWVAGTAMRRREQRAAASESRAQRLGREREAALRDERARIGRELHDVVTHSVSVMVLQVGAAREIMGQDQTRSRALLESVEASGRRALDELRLMLGLLSEQQRDAPLSPPPGVAQISSLIDQVRATGAAVEFSVEGKPRAVPSGVAVAAYRIVQEALTNVLKHAHGATARVRLRWTHRALELEIADDGPSQSGTANDIGAHPGDPAGGREAGGGRGLAGMRERAALYGGTLDTQLSSDGGYVVQARIPLEHAVV